MRTLKIISFCLILLFLEASAYPFRPIPSFKVNSQRYVSIYDLVTGTDVDHSFDVVIQRGKFYRKSHFCIYQVGLSVILLDGKVIRSDSPVVRNEKGEVLIPEDLFIEISSSFFPEFELSFKDDLYSFRDRSLSVEPKKEIAKERAPAETEKKERIDFIIIDAGHGGKDPGAPGFGLREKDLTLKIARNLAEYLGKNLSGVRIKLTRSKDVFLELGERTEIANKMLSRKSNGLFVSVHINASLSPKVSGYETYFLSQNPTNEGARSTAALENGVVKLESRSKRRRYEDMEYVEAMMLTTQIQKESSILAESIQSNMRRKMKISQSKGVKKADFFVLRGSLMPAVLVEVGYISNRKESSYLRKSSYQESVAAAVGDGIVRFVDNYNKLIYQ